MYEDRPKIPRMRTAAKIVAEIKALDPSTGITEHYIRQLVRDGIIPVAWAGKKALINLDDVLALMYKGTEPHEPEVCIVGGIRRIDEKRRA